MYFVDRLVDARSAEVLPQTAMQVVDRLVDARCAEVEVLPQTTERSEPQPLEPLEFELETNLHDLVVRVEASQASSRARARGTKNESTEVDQSARRRHSTFHVQVVDQEEVASLHHRRHLLHETDVHVGVWMGWLR